MDEYIEKNTLYAKIADLEVLARNRYLDTPSNSPAYTRYMAQLDERTRLKHMIADFPAVDVAPVKHGKWIITISDGDEYSHMNCSVCNCYWRETNHIKFFKYCPNCGAKMDLEE